MPTHRNFGVAPRVSVVPGFMGTPHISVWARLMLWPKLREMGRGSGCLVQESWGIISRKFTIAGTTDQINRFIELGWEDEYVRKGLQEALDDARHR